MSPWECPRCKRINAAWSAQCTCRADVGLPRQFDLQRSTQSLECNQCGEPFSLHRRLNEKLICP